MISRRMFTDGMSKCGNFRNARKPEELANSSPMEMTSRELAAELDEAYQAFVRYLANYMRMIDNCIEPIWKKPFLK